eukprot:TRINITY_DN50259_c0_g1_i1.p1 TRINITY_DN50259_c0_g1~~TRINITY_DN50259_c0_g1_i1.p1  ORF type:complete len:614 (-),score=93.50 TRINITY_DN50259_c0_g1_i1:101-1942(-)
MGPPPPPRGKGPSKGKGPPKGKGSQKGDGHPPVGLPNASGNQGLGATPSNVISGPRMRPLFWNIVKTIPPESVWESLDPPAPFNQEHLEKCFAMAQSKPTKEPFARDGAENCREHRKRLRVLDDRTSQNLAIAFRRLPPPDRLTGILNTLEDFPECLPAEAVIALNSAFSDHGEAVEQLRQLQIQESDVAKLDFPERYLWVLTRVHLCSTKLACGALIVGPARELGDLRYAGSAVGICCRALRESSLLGKCISTSLAVGNFMNRGTARSDAKGVVLPDSLLKLDELRGQGQGIESPRNVSGGSAPSLLDVITQALVDEAACVDGKGAHALRAEANELQGKVKAALSVSLEEAQASCLAVCTEAELAWTKLKELPKGQGVYDVSNKVRWICEEAITARTLLMGAKTELAKTQAWSSAKGTPKCDEWLASWHKFLQRLSDSFSRSKPPAAAAIAVCVGRKSKAGGGPLAKSADEVRNHPISEHLSSEVHRQTEGAPPCVATPKDAVAASSSVASAGSAVTKSAAVKQQQSSPPPFFDEDARIEAIDIGRLLAGRSEVSKTSSFSSEATSSYKKREVLVPIPAQPPPPLEKPKTYSLFIKNAPPLCSDSEGKENCS